MGDISAVRLAVMRLGYIVHHEGWTSSHEAASSLLAALSFLAVFGIRYPLQMLPLLLFELAWKAIWLIAIALPRWLTHQMDSSTWQMVITCVAAIVICPILIPWPYFFANYVVRRGDRWW